MTWKIRKIFDSLEDPKRPLLGPNIKWLKVWGLWLPKDKLKKNAYMILNIVMFLFIFSEFIDVILSIIRSDLDLLFENMKYAMVGSVDLCKVLSLLVWQDDWRKVMDYITEEDLKRREAQDRITRDIIRKYTKHCRKITYLYWFLIFCTVLVITIQSLIQYIALSLSENKNEKYNVQIINSWLPIDHNNPLGYSIKASYQYFGLIMSAAWISSFDSNAIAIIIFCKGEIDLLRNDSKYLFGTLETPTTKKEAKVKLQECHTRYTDLIKYSRLFDSCLAPIMLLYVIVCSVSLCATAYQITFETSAFQRFITAEYLIFGISQLFMYCWHSNEVLYASRDLSLGPYESIWWSREVSEQKDIKILADQFKHDIVFHAGPFTEITVATFISIIKGAYSYYTLLSQSQED